jgi:hypothetical protein
LYVPQAALRSRVKYKGLVVAPGFIDTHFHALDGLAVQLAARDGVTTGMDLEVGSSMISKWYDEKKGAWPLNYGTCASQELSRMMVHDPEVKMDKPIDATKVFAKRAEAGIVISYPQLDVHFDEAFTKAASLRQTYIEQEGKELSSFKPETARG